MHMHVIDTMQSFAISFSDGLHKEYANQGITVQVWPLNKYFKLL